MADDSDSRSDVSFDSVGAVVDEDELTTRQGEGARPEQPWISVYPPEIGGYRNDHEDEIFTVRRVGPSNAPPRNAHPFDYATLFLTQDVVRKLVLQTNVYARQVLAAKALWIATHPHSRFRRWKPVTATELLKWIGLTLNSWDLLERRTSRITGTSPMLLRLLPSSPPP
jgi:hypothetical protein